MIVWKKIPGFPGYEVNNIGEVRSYKTNSGATFDKPVRILKQQISHNGYMKVALAHQGKMFHTHAHRLVALAFIGEPPLGSQVCHNNGNKTDNRVENLRYDDQFGNMQDAINQDRVKRGTEVNTNKLSERDVLLIRKIYATGRISQLKLARCFGVCKATVYYIIHNKNWKHLSDEIK